MYVVFSLLFFLLSITVSLHSLFSGSLKVIVSLATSLESASASTTSAAPLVAWLEVGLFALSFAEYFILKVFLLDPQTLNYVLFDRCDSLDVL